MLLKMTYFDQFCNSLQNTRQPRIFDYNGRIARNLLTREAAEQKQNGREVRLLGSRVRGYNSFGCTDNCANLFAVNRSR